jgi:cytosine deaminase
MTSTRLPTPDLVVPATDALTSLRAASSLVLRRATLVDGRVVDITILDGVIAAIDESRVRGVDVHVEDVEGYVVLPSFVEPHAHLDKALTSDVVANPSGSLEGAIASWMPARVHFQVDDIAARARRAVERYLANGTTAIRAHVDTGEGIGLRAFDAVQSLRSELDGIVDLQIVAMSSRPISGREGSNNRASLVDALNAGADFVGGAPALDPLADRAVDVLAEIAANKGVGLDLHIDETTDPNVFTLARLIEIVRHGFPGSVTASHAVSLGRQPLSRQRRVAQELAELSIAVVTLPQTNLFLQGRAPRDAGLRGLTGVRALLAEGATLAAGGDNLQDPFNPMGRIDPTETASLLVAAAHLTPNEAVHAVTAASRTALGLAPVTVSVGSVADLVALRATSLSQALASGPANRIVLRAGRIVARSSLTTHTALSDEEG